MILWTSPQGQTVLWYRVDYEKPHTLWFAWHYDNSGRRDHYEASGAMKPALWFEVEP